MKSDRIRALPGFDLEKTRRRGKIKRVPEFMSDPDDEAKDVRVEHIFEMGFPFDTDETRPQVSTQIRKAVQDSLKGGRVIHLERVDTPDLEAAGQCLIRALVTGVPVVRDAPSGDEDPMYQPGNRETRP